MFVEGLGPHFKPFKDNIDNNHRVGQDIMPATVALARQAAAAYVPPATAVVRPVTQQTGGDPVSMSFLNASQRGGNAATHTAQGDIPFVNTDGATYNCFGCNQPFPLTSNHK